MVLRMRPYPDLNTALPASFVTPSRTSKILRPGIVFTTVLALAVVSVVGLAVAATVLSSGAERTKSVNAVQALALIASLMSILYILVHGVAAKYNDPVGMVRPPELKLHATCFILARLALVFWMVSFIAACAVLGRPKACLSGTQACKLQVADVVASIVGFMATGVILTALESCKYPFEIPHVFLITRKINLRANPFAEDILDRSVSRASSFDAGPIFDGEKPRHIFQKPIIERKPLPNTSSEVTEAPDRPLTPLLPMSKRNRSGSKGWGDEWTHLRKDSGLGKKGTSASDSAVSLSYETSSGASGVSGYTGMSSSDRSSHVSLPRRAVVTRRPVRQRPRSRTVTPSSSISNLSRRSPLSSVRSAEYPHILVRPELRYCPPKIPPPHGWSPSRTSSISQLVPVADVDCLQRRPSFSTAENFVIGGPRKNLPPLPRSKPPLSRKRTGDIKVPGAFIKHRPSFESTFDYEAKLDEHVRKIEVEYVTRSQSKRNQHPGTFAKRQTGNFERLSPPPSRVDSKAKYRERKPVVQPSSPVAKIRPGTAHPTGAGKVEPEKLKAFRRLSLGDLSTGLGNLSGLGKMFD